MALKGDCDNSGTFLLRWSRLWHPLITVLAIKGRGSATIGAHVRPRLRPKGLRDDIIPVLFNPHSLRSQRQR